MPDDDAGFKIVARAAGPVLGELVGLHCDEWEPIGGEVQATERLADRAFRVRQGRERFIGYLEAYTRWASAAPGSVLAKSGLLAERERLPVVSLVFVLLTTLGIFGRLAYSRLPVLELIGREAMKESPFFDELAAVIRLEDIERVLQIRFDADAASQLKPLLEGISDLDRLTELHELAIRCRRISEFKRALTADAAAH